MPPAATDATTGFAARLIDALAQGGVVEACVSPGSRSTPLVIALHRDPRVRVHVHLDERSSAFFALGLARASRRPVVVVCTSGTAAANFLPAVVEAERGRVPLVVLTADRPPELRDWGAPQTIDQPRLYGGHVRWFAEAPVPDGSPGLDRTAAALGARAAAVASGSPPGPVHVNLPFREPLAPDRLAVDPPPTRPALREWRRSSGVAPEAIALLHELTERHDRGLLVCGPLDDPDAADAVAQLARRIGWPVFAEPTSQLRRGPHVCEEILIHGDALLAVDPFAGDHPAEVVVRLGAPPTSKAFSLWLDRHPPARLVVIDADDAFEDPQQRATDFVRGAPTTVCDALARRWPVPRKRSAWCDAFLRADAVAAKAIARCIDADDRLLPAASVSVLGETLPADHQLYVANSMAIRDLDAFLPASSRPLRVLANRGANGIDGLVSSALGAAHVAPTVLLTGDLAFLHDASGLLRAGRSEVPLVAVVHDDDGGGIFSHLPVARLGEAAGFETLFRTPHGLDLGQVCRGAGLPHVRVGTRAELANALGSELARGLPSVIEVPIDPIANLEQHRAVRAAVASALEGS